MQILLVLAFFVAVPAAIAAGSAGLLAIARRDWPPRRRSAISAGVGGLIPVLMPIGSVLSGHDGGVGPFVPIVALLGIGALMALLVAWPVARWIARRS